jgi:hypothetical protein
MKQDARYKKKPVRCPGTNPIAKNIKKRSEDNMWMTTDRSTLEKTV